MHPRKTALLLIGISTLVSGPLAATEDGDHFRPLDYLVGSCWRGKFPDREAVDTHCYSLVYGGAHIRDTHVVRGEEGEYRGETLYSWDAEADRVVYRYWNSLGGFSDGGLELDGTDIVAPGERYVGEDGQVREFRSRIRRIDADHYESRTEERQPEGWELAWTMRFERIGPVTAEGPPGRQQPEKLARLEPFVGDWVPPADDPVLEQRPDLRDQVVMGLHWGPRRMLLRVYEGFAAATGPGDPVLEGVAYWDHVEQQIDFVASTRFGWTFEGRYRALEDGRLERIYDVHYADNEEYIPEPDIEGWTRRFREIYTLSAPDRIEATLEVWRDGRWQSWGPGEYAMVRKGAAPAS